MSQDRKTRFTSWRKSVSVLSSFKCSPMMVCLKKIFNGEIIFKKETDCAITSERPDTHYCQV